MSTDSENVYRVLHPPAYCVNQELTLHVETNSISSSISSVWRLASSFNKLQVDQRSVYTCLCFITGKCWFVYLVLHLYNDGCVEMSWVKRDGECSRFKELPWSTTWHYRTLSPFPSAYCDKSWIWEGASIFESHAFIPTADEGSRRKIRAKLWRKDKCLKFLLLRIKLGRKWGWHIFHWSPQLWICSPTACLPSTVEELSQSCQKQEHVAFGSNISGGS